MVCVERGVGSARSLNFRGTQIPCRPQVSGKHMNPVKIPVVLSTAPATPWYEIARECCPPGNTPVGGPSSQTGSRENIKHSFGSVRPHAFQADGPALAREPASLIDGRTEWVGIGGLQGLHLSTLLGDIKRSLPTNRFVCLFYAESLGLSGRVSA